MLDRNKFNLIFYIYSPSNIDLTATNGNAQLSNFHVKVSHSHRIIQILILFLHLKEKLSANGSGILSSLSIGSPAMENTALASESIAPSIRKSQSSTKMKNSSNNPTDTPKKSKPSTRTIYNQFIKNGKASVRGTQFWKHYLKIHLCLRLRYIQFLDSMGRNLFKRSRLCLKDPWQKTVCLYHWQH